VRLEMLVETHIEILDVQSPSFFSHETFKKRPRMTIEDFGLNFDYHFESHLLGNRLYAARTKKKENKKNPAHSIESCKNTEGPTPPICPSGAVT